MRRDITNLHTENKKLISTLSMLGINFSLTDKLETISNSPVVATKQMGRGEATYKRNSEVTVSEMKKKHMIVEESAVDPDSMEVDPAQELHPNRYGAMNNERKSRIEENSVRNNLLKNLTPADIAIKEKAFIDDFKKLPLSSAEPWAADIYSLVGDNIIARGYTSVVIDGESIWLEIPEN